MTRSIFKQKEYNIIKVHYTVNSRTMMLRVKNRSVSITIPKLMGEMREGFCGTHM